jgi:hypothetical protein
MPVCAANVWNWRGAIRSRLSELLSHCTTQASPHSVTRFPYCWVVGRKNAKPLTHRQGQTGAGLSQRHQLSTHAGKDYPLTIGGRDGGLLPTRIDTLLVVFVRIPEKLFYGHADDAGEPDRDGNVRQI